MRIRAVNGRFGGASHDSHVWNLSGERELLKRNYENGDRGVRILGKIKKSIFLYMYVHKCTYRSFASIVS